MTCGRSRRYWANDRRNEGRGGVNGDEVVVSINGGADNLEGSRVNNIMDEGRGAFSMSSLPFFGASNTENTVINSNMTKHPILTKQTAVEHHFCFHSCTFWTIPSFFEYLRVLSFHLTWESHRRH